MVTMRSKGMRRRMRRKVIMRRMRSRSPSSRFQLTHQPPISRSGKIRLLKRLEADSAAFRHSSTQVTSFMMMLMMAMTMVMVVLVLVISEYH